VCGGNWIRLERYYFHRRSSSGDKPNGSGRQVGRGALKEGSTNLRRSKRTSLGCWGDTDRGNPPPPPKKQRDGSRNPRCKPGNVRVTTGGGGSFRLPLKGGRYRRSNLGKGGTWGHVGTTAEINNVDPAIKEGWGRIWTDRFSGPRTSNVHMHSIKEELKRDDANHQGTGGWDHLSLPMV